MSPWGDLAVVSIVSMVVGLLAVAPAVIAVAAIPLRRREPGLVRELWLRYATWAVAGALVLGAAAAGTCAWAVLVLAVGLEAFAEYARAVGLRPDCGFRMVTVGSIVSAHAAGWVGLFRGPAGAGPGMLVPALLAATVGLFLVPIVRGEAEGMSRGVGLSLLGVVAFGLMLGHASWLVILPNGMVFTLLLLVLVSLHDVAAFVAGRVAGRHRLRPAISPGKT